MKESLISKKSTLLQSSSVFLRKIHELQEGKNRNTYSLELKVAHIYCNEQPDSDKVMMAQPCNTNHLSLNEGAQTFSVKHILRTIRWLVGIYNLI